MAIPWIVTGIALGAAYLMTEDDKMKRRVFFSFKYEDVWITNTIRNSGVIDNKYQVGFVDSADREKVKKQTAANIRKWIDEQINGTSVTCILVGKNTHKSKWVKYEIERSIEKGNGLLIINMHEIKDSNGNVSQRGVDPLISNFKWLESRNIDNTIYPCCNVYDWISDRGHENFSHWIEEAAQQAGR